MKIAFLVKNSHLMRYYVSRVHDRFPVSLIILEQSTRPSQPTPGLFARLRAKGPAEIAQAIIRRFEPDPQTAIDRRRQEEIDDILGTQSRAFPADIPMLTVQDINETVVQRRLVEEAPDVILVQGTSIVKDKTLPRGIFNFNMHAGLSPYYRGGASAPWALINWDPFNIGVTLHELTEQSDAGAILAQHRVVPEPHDTSNSISLKLTKAGTDVALRLLAKHARGESIKRHPQDLSIGKCYFAQHWNAELKRYVATIDREGMIPQMLKRPSTRVRQPIIELD